jgi:hypothetical protein
MVVSVLYCIVCYPLLDTKPKSQYCRLCGLRFAIYWSFIVSVVTSVVTSVVSFVVSASSISK